MEIISASKNNWASHLQLNSGAVWRMSIADRRDSRGEKERHKKRPQIYLDTSVINFVFAADAPEKQAATVQFFQEYARPGSYDLFVSPIVVDEIRRTSDPAHREALLDILPEYSLEILEISEEREEIERLADVYMNEGIIPERHKEDALHVAIATVREMDVLLSWNYEHVVNVKKEARILAANLSEGYLKPLRLVTPLEVMAHE